jgi:hypothetical protein
MTGDPRSGTYTRDESGTGAVAAGHRQEPRRGGGCRRGWFEPMPGAAGASWRCMRIRRRIGGCSRSTRAAGSRDAAGGYREAVCCANAGLSSRRRDASGCAIGPSGPPHRGGRCWRRRWRGETGLRLVPPRDGCDTTTTDDGQPHRRSSRRAGAAPPGRGVGWCRAGIPLARGLMAAFDAHHSLRSLRAGGESVREAGRDYWGWRDLRRAAVTHRDRIGSTTRSQQRALPSASEATRRGLP